MKIKFFLLTFLVFF